MSKNVNINGSLLIYRRNDLADLLGVCRETVTKMVKRGDLPAPEKFSCRFFYWRKEVIDNWLKNREASKTSTK